MADALLRQWKILLTIPRYPQGIKIQKIITKLEEQPIQLPTYRTIQRDLDTLASIFPQLVNEKKEGACLWSINTENAVLEIPSMESPTALVFYLAQQHLKNQLPPSALQHLQTYFNTATSLLDRDYTFYSNWRNKIRILPQTQALIPTNIDAQVLNNIYTALLENRRFNGKYFPRNEDQYKHYLVNPLALLFRGTVTYLVCTLRDYKDIRLLGLHRFVEAELTDIPRSVPADFDLDQYIETGHVDYLIGDSFELELLIDENVAVHLHESKLTHNQQIIPCENGQSIFKATVCNTGQLRWWLLGFADQIEVIKPEKLREEFKQKAVKMAKKYQD